jgi:hypothetical protein
VGWAAAPVGVGGFEIGYVTDDGLEHRLSLSQAWATPFESCSPIRRFTSLFGEDYLELLPVEWRQINAYGIRIGCRTVDPYDATHVLAQPQSGGGSPRGDHLWGVGHRADHRINPVAPHPRTAAPGFVLRAPARPVNG